MNPRLRPGRKLASGQTSGQTQSLKPPLFRVLQLTLGDTNSAQHELFGLA